VCSGTCLIGYILQVKGASVALDQDGTTLGTYGNRRDAFHAVSTNHLGARS
jgi:hypothetical protein